MLTRTDRADALVAGTRCSTGEVVATAQLILGLADGIATPSSVLIMDIPGYAGPEGSLLAFADCAVVPAPSAAELADIAVATADTVKRLLGWEPRVALLSFSTKGSAEDPSVVRVREAVEQIRAQVSSLTVDGELQVDAALDPGVAAKKAAGANAVAGRANTLIFPDLNAGNIGYKLVQRLAGAGAYGPLLQGFARPVSDLSRGAGVDDIVAATIMVALCAQDRA
jgi:phosphate acetyltransferase